MSVSVQWSDTFSTTQIPDVFQTHPNNIKFSYGTAGFRGKSTILETLASRVGAIATLRSESTGNRVIGVMITASHNPEDDNGFKIIDINGGMLVETWEPLAETVANCDTSTLLSMLKDYKRVDSLEYTADRTICLAPHSTSHRNRPLVLVGYDTRPSSEFLASRVTLGILALGGVCANYGLCSTPQLHYLVGTSNDKDSVVSVPISKAIGGAAGGGDAGGGDGNDGHGHHALTIVGGDTKLFLPSLQDYYNRLGVAFKHLIHHYCKYIHTNTSTTPPPPSPEETQEEHGNNKANPAINQTIFPSFLHSIIVDCANGVGAYPFQLLWSRQHITFPSLKCINTPSPLTKVNDRSGIDYLLRNPRNQGVNYEFDEVNHPNPPIIFSVDGDCDRVGVITPHKYLCSGDHHHPDHHDTDTNTTHNSNIQHNYWSIFNGDKLGALLISFVVNTISPLIANHPSFQDVSIACIYTAYSNGAFMQYVKNAFPSVHRVTTCTGVKHLLKQTHHYDLSVYFESNGHGSIVFSQSLIDNLLSFLSTFQSHYRKTIQSQPMNALDTGLLTEIDTLLKIYEYSDLLALSSALLPRIDALSRDITSSAPTSDTTLLSLAYNTITLLWLNRLTNQYIGDGMSISLVTYIALLYQQTTLHAWSTLYTDHIAIQHPVKVDDPTRILADKEQYEQVLKQPIELQLFINDLSAQYKDYHPRCFVRPSGTEKCVRIYAESAKKETTEEIIQLVQKKIDEIYDTWSATPRDTGAELQNSNVNQ